MRQFDGSSTGASGLPQVQDLLQDRAHDMRQFQDMRHFLKTCAERNGDRTAISIFETGAWRTISYRDLYSESVETAARLQQAGMKSGDIAALLSESSIEWVKYFFAVQLCGGIVVPLDIKLTARELQSILSHAEPKFILASQQFRSMARDLRQPVGLFAKIVTINAALPYVSPDELRYEEVPLLREQTGLIVYTSGTSGAPKGVRVFSGTLLFEAESLSDVACDMTPSDVLFSMLPLNHLFGLTAGLIYPMVNGIEFCFAHSIEPDQILKCMVERKATQVLTVPLFLQMVKRGIERKVEAKGTSAELAFRLMIQSAKHLPLSMRNRMFAEIQNRFGGNLKRFICGGSPLDPEVYDFFAAINIHVYEGYGLTETGPVIAVNSKIDPRKGTVGRPLKGVEVRIDKKNESDLTGEIWTRGPHVMEGYHKNPELTAAALTTDGWFRTGDAGYLDADGYLRITGRLKSLIVLSSGKKVHPEEVEQALTRSLLVKNSCVIGLKDPHIGEMVVAVVLPADEELKRFENDFAGLERVMKEEVQKACRDLVDFKRPAKVIVRTTPFQMTSSQKVKRDTVIAELNAQTTNAKKA